MRTLLFFLYLSFQAPLCLAGEPAILTLPSSLVYPEFWHTPMGIHRGTPRLLAMLSGGRAEFNDPEGIACTRMYENGPENTQLTVFGVNSGQSCVIYNPDMLSLGFFGSQGKGPGQFDHPGGIAALPNGRVAVADTGNHRGEASKPIA